MADVRALVLLEAAQYAAACDLDSFADLLERHRGWLCLEVLLRIILTFLPESVEPALLVPVLEVLATWNSNPADQVLGDAPTTNAPDDFEPPRELHLHLRRISRWKSINPHSHDVFEDFLIDRAHRLDQETGSLIHIHDLIEPFATRSEELEAWFGSVIRPLCRLDFQFYPQLAPSHTLLSFERLHGRSGAYALLFELLRRNTEEDASIYGRDFRSILAPWIQGEARRVDILQRSISAGAEHIEDDTMDESALTVLWNDVFGALLDHAVEHHTGILSLVRNWDGPHDSDIEDALVHLTPLDPTFADDKYLQLMMALIYLKNDGASKLSPEDESAVLQRVALLLKTDLSVDPTAINFQSKAENVSEEVLENVSSIHLSYNELLDSANPLTEPSVQTLELAAFVTTSRALLLSLNDVVTIHTVTSSCLFGLAADQRAHMQRILNGLATNPSASDGFWRDARKKLLWLRRWNLDGRAPRRLGIFGQIDIHEMEVAILKTLARVGSFKLLTELYVQTEDNLPRRLAEQVLVETALTAYDNASSGNKNRGGMKIASDIIATFRHHFPDSVKFQKAHALIQATHALSFYDLTLQHGTQFSPVNLRAHANMLGLFEKVFEQNPQSYTKLDDLIDIGKNFVRAGLSLPQIDRQDAVDLQGKRLAQIERMITAKAISASLAEGDFDTAYSYVVNRLSPPGSNQSDTDQADDLLWRAAYQAGRDQSNVREGPSKLRRIEQRMELLSQAVLLAPPAALQEILETWNSCEADFNACRAENAEEEEEWNDRGDQTIPGGFTAESLPLPQKSRESTRRAMQEEAPMGLFDVARGAAAAFSKSAFKPGPAGREGASLSSASYPAADDEEQARMRKRDMVSNAVTGGLVSGIGWMLGEQHRHDSAYVEVV